MPTATLAGFTTIEEMATTSLQHAASPDEAAKWAIDEVLARTQITGPDRELVLELVRDGIGRAVRRAKRDQAAARAAAMPPVVRVPYTQPQGQPPAPAREEYNPIAIGARQNSRDYLGGENDMLSSYMLTSGVALGEATRDEVLHDANHAGRARDDAAVRATFLLSIAALLPPGQKVRQILNNDRVRTVWDDAQRISRARA